MTYDIHDCRISKVFGESNTQHGFWLLFPFYFLLSIREPASHLIVFEIIRGICIMKMALDKRTINVNEAQIVAFNGYNMNI